MTKFVIINADDFGLSDGVCKSILNLFEERAISSTSLMVAAPNAIENIKKWNGKQLLGQAGVHLQLTNGSPISSSNEVLSLIETTSSKFRDPRGGTPVKLNEVEKEWRKQIEIATELLGGNPTHLDSHHGVHRIPELFNIYVGLGKEYNIPLRGAVAGDIRTKIELEKINASVAIVREWTGKGLNSENLISQLTKVSQDNPNENIIEIIAHPGFCDEYLKSISSLSVARENDYYELLSLAQKNMRNQSNYKIISYKDIENGFR
jgi:predicted glycoside hydrolase/deacetylase ChbG (UPF0249 family)